MPAVDIDFTADDALRQLAARRYATVFAALLFDVCQFFSRWRDTRR